MCCHGDSRSCQVKSQPPQHHTLSIDTRGFDSRVRVTVDTRGFYTRVMVTIDTMGFYTRVMISIDARGFYTKIVISIETHQVMISIDTGDSTPGLRPT